MADAAPVLRPSRRRWGVRLDAQPAGQAQRAQRPSSSTRSIAAIDAAADDPAVRVIVIAGAGRAFCAGYDLTEEADGAIDGPVEWRDLLAGTSP